MCTFLSCNPHLIHSYMSAYLIVFGNGKSKLSLQLIQVLGHATCEIPKSFVHCCRPLHDTIAMKTGLLVQCISFLKQAFHFLFDFLKSAERSIRKAMLFST